MNGKGWSLLAGVACTALLHGPSPGLAQSLGAAQSFAILGGSAVNANGTGSVINGDVGVSPAAGIFITGFPPGTGATVLPPFSIHGNDGPAIAARAAFLTLNASLLAGSCTPLSSDQLDTQNLGPGCHSGGALDLASGGTLTLSGAGIYIFRAASSLTANTLSQVVLNGVDPCNVFWQVTSLATLNGATFVGTVVAQAGVHLGSGASLTGRALAAAAGDVTLAGTNTVGGCSGTGSVPPPGAPTLSKDFSPATVDQNVPSTLTITLSNPNTSVATLTAAFTDTLPAGVVIAALPNASTTCGGGTTVTTTTNTITLAAGRSIPAGGGSTPGTCIVKVNVTAAAGGSYVNTLAAGALVTTNGNNANPAVATLTVNPTVGPGIKAPTVSKSFSPSTINAGVGNVSTLTIVLSNSSTDNPDTITTLTDNLPAGLVIATPNGATSNCAGGTLTAVAGTRTIVLSGGTIPAAGSTVGTCTVTVNVTAAAGGSYLNTLVPGALVTNNGSNTAPAIVTLTVNSRVPLGPPVPTLSGWALIMLTAVLALVGFAAMRRQTT